MKTNIFLLFSTFLLLFSNTLYSKEEEVIKVYSEPGLYNLTTKWANEYGKSNPGVSIDVVQVPVSGMAENLQTTGGLGFVSDNTSFDTNRKSFWKVIVGRNVIVPVMSAENPFLKEISEQGISPKSMALSMEDPTRHQWGNLLNGTQINPIHYYILNDESVISSLAGYLKLTPDKLKGITMVNEQEMVTALGKDPYAIGFCKMVNVLDKKTQDIVGTIRLLPIDKNGNGKIDYMEKIYDDFALFTRGVWIGKYPKALSGEIFSVSSLEPSNDQEVAFLKWVLTEGQQYLVSAGYTDLVNNERQMQLDQFTTPQIYTITAKDPDALAKWILLGTVVLIIFTLYIDWIVRKLRNKSASTSNSKDIPVSHGIFDENSVVIPKGLYFDKTHTWAFMEQGGSVKMGIDDFLQHITGPITRIEMKKNGEKIKKGECIVSVIQKGKQLNIYSPVSGTILEQNKALTTNSFLLNSSPYSEGWIYLIEPTNWLLELQFLSMAEKYKNWLQQEFTRLKDFLAVSLKPEKSEYAHVVIQDGGVLKDNILADLGPEVWEDFQRKFLDKSK